MWTTVYMAQNKENAECLRVKIETEGIIVMLRAIHTQDTAVDECYEILVPKAELETALDIIIGE